MRLKTTTTKSNTTYTIIKDYTNLKGKRSTCVYEALGNLLDACCKERDKTSIVGEWISPFDRGPDIDRDVLIKDKDGNRFVGHRNANYGWMSNDDYTQLDVYDLVGWVEIPE